MTTAISPTHPETDIPQARSAIDALDAEIITLIAQRVAAGQGVVHQKAQSGLARIDQARERQVLQTYAEALGPDGVHIILHILRMSRGAL